MFAFVVGLIGIMVGFLLNLSLSSPSTEWLGFIKDLRRQFFLFYFTVQSVPVWCSVGWKGHRSISSLLFVYLLLQICQLAKYIFISSHWYVTVSVICCSFWNLSSHGLEICISNFNPSPFSITNTKLLRYCLYLYFKSVFFLNFYFYFFSFWINIFLIFLNNFFL
jgi:hypothetical protein